MQGYLFHCTPNRLCYLNSDISSLIVSLIHTFYFIDRGTDGQQFHPNVQEDETLYVFTTEACGSFPLVFEVGKLHECTRNHEF